MEELIENTELIKYNSKGWISISSKFLLYILVNLNLE